MTPKGKLIYNYAKQVLDLQKQLQTKIEVQREDSITIGTIETIATYVLPQAIQQLKNTFHDTTIKVIINTESQLKKMLANQEIDIACIFDTLQEWDNTYSISSQSIAFYLISATTNFDRSTLILTDKNCTYRAKLLSDFELEDSPYQISMELDSAETIKGIVKSQLGTGFLPEYTLTDNDNTLNKMPHPLSENFHVQIFYHIAASDQYTATSYLLQQLTNQIKKL